jgi:hypothetical protein
MNEWVYQIACFMIVRNPHHWRWSHARHHTDTYIVGRDPEIADHAPARLCQAVLDVFGLIRAPDGLEAHDRQRRGRSTPEEATYIPDSEKAQGHPRGPRLGRDLRRDDHAAVATGSILPLLLIGVPAPLRRLAPHA